MANPNNLPVRDQIEAFARNRSNVSENLRYPLDNETDYGMLFIFKDYKYRTSENRGFSQLPGSSTAADTVITDTVLLPLPENLHDSFNINITASEQGAMGEFISNLMSNVDISNLNNTQERNNIYGDIRNFVGNTPGVSDFRGTDIAYLIRSGVSDVLNSDTLRNVDIGTGTTVNPKTALMFSGVVLKNHTFSWKLAPRSKAEADNIQRINETIKKNILPSYINTGVFKRAMFKYPSMADIFFVGIDPRYYFYFKTVMVNSFDINYTPTGRISILKGGIPSEVVVSMMCTQSDIHTSEDYGGSSTDIGTIVETADTPNTLVNGPIPTN